MVTRATKFVADDGELALGGRGDGEDVVITREHLEIHIERLERETVLQVKGREV